MQRLILQIAEYQLLPDFSPQNHMKSSQYHVTYMIFNVYFYPSFCVASPDILSHNNVYPRACLSCSSDIDMIIIMFTYIFVLAIFFIRTQQRELGLS